MTLVGFSSQLASLQDEINEISNTHKGIWKEDEKKIKAQFQTLYHRRAEIIRNVDPKFWASVLVSHPDLNTLWGPHDLEILDDLENFFVDEDLDTGNFTIRLSFRGTNKYLADKELWKEFSLEGKPLKHSGCRWKEGLEVTPLLQHSTKKEGSVTADGSVKRPRIDEVPSFFTFFMEDKDEETEADIAACLKSEVWEEPFETLLGCDEEDDDDDDDDDLLEKGEEDEDEDGDGEEEEEQEDEADN